MLFEQIIETEKTDYTLSDISSIEFCILQIGYSERKKKQSRWYRTKIFPVVWPVFVRKKNDFIFF